MLELQCVVSIPSINRELTYRRCGLAVARAAAAARMSTGREGNGNHTQSGHSVWPSVWSPVVWLQLFIGVQAMHTLHVQLDEAQ